MAYPRPKQVRHKPSTEINPSIVNMRFSPPFPDSLSGFYVNGGSQSLRGGLTAYHPGSPKEILPHFDRDFNRIHFGVGKVAGSIFSVMLVSQRYKKDWKTLILSGFQSKCPLFELGVFFAVLNCICLSIMQIHAYFYFNYIIYSGLLIFCCQNVAISSL